MTPVPRMSFVVPVRNDAQRLRRCLVSITANEYPREAYEILVMDNGSTDGSSDVARSMGASVASVPDGRVSELRNRAAALASGDILAFVDADHAIAPTWIAAALDVLETPSVGAAGALYSIPPDSTWVQTMYGALRGRTKGRGDARWLGSGNLAVKRRAFEAIGGFDPTLESCEDVDFCQRLRSAGWRIVADESLESVHWGDPATLAHLFRAERWRGRDNLRVSFKGSLTLRELVSVIVPVVDALAVLTVVTAVVATPLLGRGALAAVSTAAAMIGGLSALRTVRIVASTPIRHPVGIGQALLVALTYDVARAVALLARAPHHRQPEQHQPAGATGLS